jgi:hypothetical protein
VITGSGQQIDADRTDATSGTGDDDGSVIDLDAAVEQGLHAHRGGEARRADRHGLPGVQRAQRHQLVCGQARVLGVAAVLARADVVAVGQHSITDYKVGGV